MALLFFAGFGWLIGKNLFSANLAAPITTLPDGSANLDPTFQIKMEIDDFIRCVDLQSDGKILIGGGFETIDSVESARVGRLNSDGTFDKEFAASANNVVYCIAGQEDGKVVIAGDFTNVSGVDCKGVARLDARGILDPGFKLLNDLEGNVRAILVQSDGKIVVAGQFARIHGEKKSRIARLNSDGTLDETFKGAANNVIWTLAGQRDRKILIGGDFTIAGSGRRNRIARLNRDGELDANFSAGSGANGGIFAIAVQYDGKILIGGDFTEFNQRPRNRVARLDPDGSLDATFNPGPGPNNGIRALALQRDQKIVLGGAFKFFNDTELSHIARLHPNGSLDESFATGAGFSDGVRILQVQKDGKILAAGGFTSYNGVACSRIVRLRGTSIKAKK